MFNNSKYYFMQQTYRRHRAKSFRILAIKEHSNLEVRKKCNKRQCKISILNSGTNINCSGENSIS